MALKIVKNNKPLGENDHFWQFLTKFLFFIFLGDVYSFLGNQTHKDHFKLLQMDGSSLLIGARNVIYNLSINDLTENDDQVRSPLIN